MLGALGRWWRKRQRRIDVEILWPCCKEEEAPSMYMARSVFRHHCIYDPAWTKDLSLIEIEEIVGRLS